MGKINKANGEFIPGLLKRRLAELANFFGREASPEVLHEMATKEAKRFGYEEIMITKQEAEYKVKVEEY